MKVGNSLTVTMIEHGIDKDSDGLDMSVSSFEEMGDAMMLDKIENKSRIKQHLLATKPIYNSAKKQQRSVVRKSVKKTTPLESPPLLESNDRRSISSLLGMTSSPQQTPPATVRSVATPVIVESIRPPSTPAEQKTNTERLKELRLTMINQLYSRYQQYLNLSFMLIQLSLGWTGLDMSGYVDEQRRSMPEYLQLLKEICETTVPTLEELQHTSGATTSSSSPLNRLLVAITFNTVIYSISKFLTGGGAPPSSSRRSSCRKRKRHEEQHHYYDEEDIQTRSVTVRNNFIDNNYNDRDDDDDEYNNQFFNSV